MDEPKVRPGFPGDRSQAASDKLRALRERANQALEEHRRRVGDIETQLNERVRQLAEEFGGPDVPEHKGSQDNELATLRRQLEEGRAKHEKFVEQLAAARKQLDAIQSQPCEACQQSAERLGAVEDEARRLRESLAAATKQHEEDAARHKKFVEQLAVARQALTELQQSKGESTAEISSELAAARASAAAAEEQLAAAARDMDALHVECDAMRARAEELEHSLDAANAELDRMRQQATALENAQEAADERVGDLRSQLADAKTELQRAQASETALAREVESFEAKLQQIAAERDRLVGESRASDAEKQSLAASLSNLQSASSAQLQDLTRQLAAAGAEADQLRRQAAAGDDDRTSLKDSLAKSQATCRELEAALAAAEQRLASIQDQLAAGAEAPVLRAEISDLQAAALRSAETIAELESALEEARRELASQRDASASDNELEALRRELESAKSTIDEQQQAAAAQSELLSHVQAELGEAREAAASPSAELAALQQKFELALADVQKLKRDNGSLREELAQRPASGDEQAPELIALRTERDRLADRVAELESAVAAAASIAPDSQQEFADLQRRFELAVDDVRQLKKENAQLREQAASAGGSGGESGAGQGGLDWASQKARLMAMLEEEDGQGDVSPEREQERATVQKTIAATDRVIADKDREIAELRATLESNQAIDEDAIRRAREREQLLDADAVVTAERERLAALKAEWEDKLRAAELEFSVERAKLAREQNAVRERMFEMESGLHAAAAPADPAVAGKPRRRWLSALGLGEEEEPKKK